MNIINGQIFYMVVVVDDIDQVARDGESLNNYELSVFQARDEAMLYIRDGDKQMTDVFVMFECRAVLKAHSKLEVIPIKKSLPDDDE